LEFPLGRGIKGDVYVFKKNISNIFEQKCKLYKDEKLKIWEKQVGWNSPFEGGLRGMFTTVNTK